MPSPFLHGNPVPPNLYIEPKNGLLRTIVERFLNSGLSTAIVSEPRFGKTSLLQYLISPPIVQAINTITSQEWQHVFYYIDVHALEASYTPAQFWKRALTSVKTIVDRQQDQDLHDCFASCFEEDFDIVSLEELLTQMARCRIRLVLLLDEFDDLLALSNFESGPFFAGLRSLSTRMESLALIITTRLSIGELNAQKQFEHFGSPYFNYFHQIFLGAFSAEATNRLLGRASDRFSKEDKEFLVRLTGRHPYFLQVAADALWNAYTSRQNAANRIEYVFNQLSLCASHTLSDTWRHWPQDIRVALEPISKLHTCASR